jgi:hypothetical protein
MAVQTTTETAGAGNNQQIAVGVAMETGVMAAVIMAVRLRWQEGPRRGRSDNDEGSSNGNNSGGEFIPHFSLGHGER